MTGPDNGGDLCMWAGLKELATGIAVPVIIGLIAGFVSLLRIEVEMTWRMRMVRLSMSCIVAILTAWGLDYMSLPPTVDAAITGGMALMGVDVLDALKRRVLRDIEHGRLPGGNRDGE